MRPLGRPYEVIYVDDGSTDGSPGVLLRAGPRGPGDADRPPAAQLGAVGGPRTPASASPAAASWSPSTPTSRTTPRTSPGCSNRWTAYDVVSGVRANRQDTWVRKVSSRIANRVRNRVTHDNVTDVGCTLRACRTEYLRRIPVFTGMHRFLPTLLKMAGARVTEVPVNHRPRLHGQPKYNISNRLWRALADLFAVRWMQKRWIDRRLSEEIDVWTQPALDRHRVHRPGPLLRPLLRPVDRLRAAQAERDPRRPSGSSAWRAALMLLVYAIHRRDPVFIVGPGHRALHLHPQPLAHPPPPRRPAALATDARLAATGPDRRRRDLLILALLGALLFLPGLGRRDVWNPDEARYAEVAREMRLLGHWAVPHLNGAGLHPEAAAALLVDRRLRLG